MHYFRKKYYHATIILKVKLMTLIAISQNIHSDIQDNRPSPLRNVFRLQ